MKILRSIFSVLDQGPRNAIYNLFSLSKYWHQEGLKASLAGMFPWKSLTIGPLPCEGRLLTLLCNLANSRVSLWKIYYAWKKKSLFINSTGTLGKCISLGFFGPMDLYRCELSQTTRKFPSKNTSKKAKNDLFLHIKRTCQFDLLTAQNGLILSKSDLLTVNWVSFAELTCPLMVLNSHFSPRKHSKNGQKSTFLEHHQNHSETLSDGPKWSYHIEKWSSRISLRFLEIFMRKMVKNWLFRSTAVGCQKVS